MGLADVFGKSSKKEEEKDPEFLGEVGNFPPPVDKLDEQARLLVELSDDAQTKTKHYNDTKKEMLAEVDRKLDALKTASDLARKLVAENAKQLHEAMEASDVVELPIIGRAPVHIKLIKGKAKSITKTWLISPKGMGPQAGEALWKRRPTSDDRKELVIPAKPEVEPGD